MKSSLWYAQCSFSWIPLSFVKSDSGKKCLDIINDVHVITHIHTVKCAFELQNRWSHSQSWWCASFWHSFQCNYAITFFIAMFQRVTPRWRYEVVPQLQRCFQLLLEFTRSWNVFEQYCPRCDLNVLFHWLSFLNHIVLHSSVLHLIIFLCPLANLNTACFPSRDPLYCPQSVSTFQGVLRRVDVISCQIFRRLDRCSSLFDNLSYSGISYFKGHVYSSLIVEMKLERYQFWKRSFKNHAFWSKTQHTSFNIILWLSCILKTEINPLWD
jgi:hypothetical protein